MASFLNMAKAKLESVHADGMSYIDGVKDKMAADKHSHTHIGEACAHGLHNTIHNRYDSFAIERTENDAKWFVDGCGYMWAVSVALEEAKESIWILDCE